MEMVISAHKSVAELGVIGRAEHMHLIMDAERDATVAYLDRVTRRMGGRRGVAAVATETDGLIYAHTRHATSRAGDPCPHDHVLLGERGPDARRQGRVEGARHRPVAGAPARRHHDRPGGRRPGSRWTWGMRIEADPGPSGRLGHWRIAGVPDEVMEVHSKRAAEITAECQRRGDSSYRARAVAARDHPQSQRNRGGGGRSWSSAGMPSWPGSAGRCERLTDAIDAAAADRPRSRPGWTSAARRLLSEILGHDGELARRKVFFRRDVIVALAPHLYGQDPRLIEALADRALADPETVPLVGVPGARERPHTLASVIAREVAIAESLARQIDRADAPAVEPARVQRAVAAVEAGAGRRLPVRGAATSGRGHLHLGAGRGAGRGGGRRREDNDAAGRGRRVRRRRLPGARYRHLRSGGPQPGHRSRHRRVPRPWPA